MGTVVVVVANPAVESFKPGTVAGVELGVGPLAQHRLDESLGLAVGLGPAAADELVFGAHVIQGISEVETARKCESVVGHDALDADAALCEEGRRVEQKRGRGASLLVREDLGKADPRKVVDSNVDVVVTIADLVPSSLPQHSVPTAVGNAPEPLDIDVDQLAWVVLDVPDRNACGPVAVPQPRETVAAKDLVDSRTRDTQEGTDLVRSLAPTTAHLEDALDVCVGQPSGRRPRSRRSVFKAGHALFSESPEPLVGRCSRHAEGLGSSRHRPAKFDHTLDKQDSSELGELRPRMDHERPPAGLDSTPISLQEGFSAVNNVCRHYT